MAPFAVASPASAAPPGAPINVTAEQTWANLAIVRWTTPADNGTVIDSYVATASPGGFACTAQVFYPETATGGFCAMLNLPTNVTYTFTVAAISGVETGSSSEPSAPMAMRVWRAPGAPTNVVARISASRTITVTWEDPVDLGYPASIQRYRLREEALIGFRCESEEGVRECTFPGVSAGPHSFTVQAVNAWGTGPRATSNTIQLDAQPPPQNVTAVTTGNSITVSWDPASGDHIGEVTYGTLSGPYYEEPATASIRPYPAHPECASPRTELSCTLVGTTPGVLYAVFVRATNSHGFESQSVLVAVRAPFSAPTGVGAVAAGSRSASVSWVAPDGPVPAGYIVAATPGGSTCTTPAGVLACTVTGLTPSTAYTFTVTASYAYVDAPAAGPASQSSDVVVTAAEPVPAPVVVTLPPVAQPAPTPVVATPVVATPVVVMPAAAVALPVAQPVVETLAPAAAPTSAVITAAAKTVITGPTRPVQAVASRPVRIAMTLQASGVPLRNTRVSFVVRPKGSKLPFRTYRTLVTDNVGAAAVQPALISDTEFQLRYAGSATAQPAASRVVVVNVARAVTAALTRNTVRRGSLVRVAGTVATESTRQLVYLQRLDRVGWRTVALTHVDARKRFTFTVPTGQRGRFSYRVVRPTDPRKAQGVSGRVALTVR